MRRHYNEDDEMYDTEEQYRDEDEYDEEDYEEEEPESLGFPIKKVVYGVLSVVLVGGILVGLVPIIQKVALKDEQVVEQPIDNVSAVADNDKKKDKPKKEEKVERETTEAEDEEISDDLFEDIEAEEVATPTPNPEKEQKKKEEAEKQAQKKEQDKSLSSKVGTTSKNGYLKVEGTGEGATNKNETYVVDDSGSVFAYFGSGVLNAAQTIYTSVDAAQPVANLEANTKVDIIDDIPDWYEVRTMEGITGYIPKSAVTLQQ